MKWSFILFAAWLLSANTNLVVAQKAVKQYPIEEFYKTTSFGGGHFNRQENKLLITDNSSGIYNIYELDLNTLKKKPLTQSKKESLFSVDYIPGSSAFIYASDKGGNENTHLYLQKEEGKVVDLTPGEKEKVSFAGWNKAKTGFYYTSNARDPKAFDLYRMNLSDWKTQLLYKNDKALDIGSVSPDETHMLLTKNVTTDKTDLYLLNRKTNELKKISGDDVASATPQDWEKDNSAFYYTTNEDNEYTYVVKYDILTGNKEKIFSTGWDVVFMNLSENGKYHIIGINEDGRNKILLFDHASGKQLQFPELKDGFVLGANVSPSEKNMMLYVGSDRSPTNLYIYNIETKKLQKLTNALNPAINPDDLVSAEVIRFSSFDSLEIPAILYKPHQASAQNKVPALVWVHGGSGGQSRAGYSQAIQFLVNHGYAVLAVNNRGSSGYGKTFYRMDNRNHGDKDLKDCVWGKKWLARQPYIDANKIGIYGGSYGGFMALAGIIQYPQEFAVGVDVFGVTNWMRTLRSIPPYWESFREALYDEMGDPNGADSVRLYNVSPLFNAHKIRTPLLVLQGANDPRVLQVESDEIVAAARKNGVPVQYVLFPDEGHGFTKKENQIKATRETLAFLDQHLKGKGNTPTQSVKKAF